MPLVHISQLKGSSSDRIRSIADGVHKALVEVFDTPPDDRFQIIHTLEPGQLIYDSGYLGINRTDDLVLIEIVASRTRTTAAKQALYAAITDNLSRGAGLRHEDVIVVLSPNDRDDWSFGNGVASYVRNQGTETGAGA